LVGRQKERNLKIKLTKSVLHGSVAGFIAGILNGLLGAGGGMAIVPMLERSGLEPARAHATSIAVIVPLCILSAAFYLQGGSLSFSDALSYIPAGLVGAFAGAKLLPHIPARILRRIFGAFMLYAAYRLLWG
jgi:uncharacterized membrane protein YfcA